MTDTTMNTTMTLHEVREAAEREAVTNALNSTRTRPEAAQMLGVSVSGLNKMLARLGIRKQYQH